MVGPFRHLLDGGVAFSSISLVTPDRYTKRVLEAFARQKTMLHKQTQITGASKNTSKVRWSWSISNVRHMSYLHSLISKERTWARHDFEESEEMVKESEWEIEREEKIWSAHEERLLAAIPIYLRFSCWKWSDVSWELLMTPLYVWQIATEAQYSLRPCMHVFL